MLLKRRFTGINYLLTMVGIIRPVFIL